MKSLQLRLLVAIGASFALFWALSSIWTLVDLRKEFREALDERLAGSARMVAALVADLPVLTARSAPQELPLPEMRSDSVVCEIRFLKGGIVGRTRNSPDRLGLAAPGFQTRVIDGVAWRSYTIEQNAVRITTADRVERREHLFRNVAFATVVPFLVAMVATLGALWFAIRRCLRPLERVRGALAARAPDALQPLPVDDLPRELAPLVSTVNCLLAKIERTIERERRFTGDAAHELRTPLTAVKIHLQVARLGQPGRAGAIAIDHAEQGVRRLQSTIEQLLMLARVEGSGSFEADERMDARTVINHAIAMLPGAAVPYICIVDERAADCVLSLPASLAITAVRNLLDNALRYGVAERPVVIRMQRADRAVNFTVDNEGEKMNDADIANAGQRFWRKGAGQGSGLGLSIVQAIVARYGGSWQLQSGSHGGMSARLTLSGG